MNLIRGHTMSRSALVPGVAVAMLLLLPSIASGATDPCDGFTWDVRTERALFALEPTVIVAGTGTDTAPLLEVGHLYELSLHPRERVTFAVAPERTKNTKEPLRESCSYACRVSVCIGSPLMRRPGSTW